MIALIAADIVLPLFLAGPFKSTYAESRSKLCSNNFGYNLLHITNLLPEPGEIVRYLHNPVKDLNSFSF